jgi:AP endonuclease 1
MIKTCLLPLLLQSPLRSSGIMVSDASSVLSPVHTRSPEVPTSAKNVKTRPGDAKLEAAVGAGRKRRVEEAVEGTPKRQRRATTAKQSYKEEEDEEEVVKPSPRKDRNPRKTASARVKSEVESTADTKQSPQKAIVVKEEEEAEQPSTAKGKTAVKRQRKTKEEKDAEAMPLAARTVGSKLFLGAHVSAAGGVHNAVANSVHIG